MNELARMPHRCRISDHLRLVSPPDGVQSVPIHRVNVLVENVIRSHIKTTGADAVHGHQRHVLVRLKS